MADALDDIRRIMPQIDNAAGDLCKNLSRTGIIKDIALAAELAGLTLLRQSNPKIPDVPPGTAVIGLVAPELFNRMDLFIASNAQHMGLKQKDVASVKLPPDATAYCTDLNRYEPRFREICRSHGMKVEHTPFVAAFAAMKFIGGGAQMGFIDKNFGFALALYHLAAGWHTVPYPQEPKT